MGKIIDELRLNNFRKVLSFGQRAILLMLAQNPPSVQVNLSEQAVGRISREGMRKLRVWGLVDLKPILTESERYEMSLTDLGKKVVTEIEEGLGR